MTSRGYYFAERDRDRLVHTIKRVEQSGPGIQDRSIRRGVLSYLASPEEGSTPVGDMESGTFDILKGPADSPTRDTSLKLEVWNYTGTAISENDQVVIVWVLLPESQGAWIAVGGRGQQVLKAVASEAIDPDGFGLAEVWQADPNGGLAVATGRQIYVHLDWMAEGGVSINSEMLIAFFPDQANIPEDQQPLSVAQHTGWVIIAAECEAPPPAGICDACAADFDIDIGGSQPGGCITATSLGPGDPGVDYDLDTYQAVATNVGTIQSFSTIFATTAAMSAAMVPGFSGVVPNDAVGIRCGWVHDSGDPGNPLTNYAELAIKLPGSAMELLSASMLSVVDDTLQLVITSNVDGTYDINTYHGFTSVPLLNVTRDFTAKDPIHWRVNGATNHFCNLSPCRSAPVNQSGTN